jgi:hypothetical protein
MKNLWRVDFDVKYTGIGEWMSDNAVHVVGNGDGLKVIAKARKIVLRHEFEDDGIIRRAINARVVALERQQEVNE